MDGPVVLVEGLAKWFGARPAVSELTFQVRAGEVLGLLGPNGSGKTTTLRMLAGLLRPSAGRVRVCGVEVTVDPLGVRRHLGFMTASTGLYERLTPREIIRTFGVLHEMSRADLERRLDALASQLELGAFLDRRCGSLSSGQKQRVSIARAIVHDPPLYVLDEPTAALDPLAARAILELVVGARAAGRAVLFSTHRMEEAEHLCDRLVFLRGGRAVAEGTPRALVAESREASLTAAFLHYAAQREDGR